MKFKFILLDSHRNNNYNIITQRLLDFLSNNVIVFLTTRCLLRF